MKLIRRAVAFGLALTVAGAAWAQQTAPAGTAPAKEAAVVGRFSIVSVDAINKVLAELGVPNAGDFNIQENMENAPFLGKGALALDKPMGVAIVAGPQHRLLPIEDSVIFSIPVAPGKVTETDLRAAGGAAVDGSPATFSMQGFILRRTADYLFMKEGAGPFGLAAMVDTVFASEYKDGTNLASFSANLDALRKTAPEAYKELAKNIADLPKFIFGMGGAGGGGETGAGPVTGVLDKIDRITLALGQDDKNLHLKSWLAPSPLAAKSREAPRPAFPGAMIVQMHLVYPTPEAAAFVEKQLTALPEDFFGGELPPVYHQRVKDLVLRAANLNTKTDAVSLGFGMKEGHPVFYIVDQFSEAVDAGKELAEIAETGVALGTEAAGLKIALDNSSYDAAGKKVQRLVFTAEGAKTKVVVDEVQSGKVAYIAISDNTDGKYVAELAGAGLNGNSSVLCAGAIDLGAAVTAALESGGLPGLSPDALQKLKAAYAGQAITWTMQSSEQNFLFTDITVPKSVIRELIKAESGPAQGNAGGPIMP